MYPALGRCTLQLAKARILAGDDDAAGIGGHQGPGDRVAAVVVGHRHHLGAGREAQRVGGIMVGPSRRLSRLGDLKRLGRRHLAALAKAGRWLRRRLRHAFTRSKPGQQLIHDFRHRAAQEPEVHVGGDVGEARLGAGQIVRVRQRRLDPGRLGAPLALHRQGAGLHRRGVERPAGKLLAVLDEGLRHLDLAEDDRHRGAEERPVGPEVDRPAGAVQLMAGAGGDLGQDHLGVAIDVGADLHHRDAPVAAGERRQVGFRHDRRLDHRMPGKAQEPEQQPGFLRERRVVVVVQDEVGHEPLLERRTPGQESALM